MSWWCVFLFFSEEGVCVEMTMVCLNDFEEYAKQHLSKATWDYYAAGADECSTRDDNLLAYKRYYTAVKGMQILSLFTHPHVTHKTFVYLRNTN